MTSIFRLVPPQRLSTLALASAMALMASAAHADERSELEQLRATTMSLMQTLIDSGLLTREKADDILRQARKATVADAPAESSGKEAAAKDSAAKDDAAKPKVIRVPYVTEATKAEMREQIKKEVLAQAHDERWGDAGAMPAWLRRITVEGDLRVRFQNEIWSGTNTPVVDAQGGFSSQTSGGVALAWAPDVNNSQTNRERMTLRARVGIKSDLGNGLSAAVRLSTGSSTGPSSASQTQGNYFNKYATLFDQAYVKYDHEGKGSVVAGRFANPFYGTDLTWPDDLNFDGLAMSIKPVLGAGQTAFMTVGAFPLQELETSTRDKWLYGVQIGTALTLAPNVFFRAGLAMYDFNHVEGVSDTNLAPDKNNGAYVSPYLTSEYPFGVRQKGNTLIRINNGADVASSASVWGLASKFRPVDLSADLTFLQFFPTTVKVSLDFIKNIGFNEQDIHNRAGSALDGYTVAKKNTAAQVKLAVGVDRIERAGQWQSFLTLRRFERDAWVDAFTDTTWHLGGTNYQGWSIGGQYGLGHGTSLGMRWTSTRNLTDSTLYGGSPGYSSATLKIDVLQVELNSRF
jgi:hypothetical protein